MSLPSSRDLTYTGGAPVDANNLNNIQDCIVSGKVGTVGKWLELDNLGNTGKWNRGASSNTYWFEPNVNPAEAAITIPLKVGDRIVSVDFYLYDNNGADNITVKIWKQSIANGGAPGSAVQVGSTGNTSGSASTNIQKVTVTPGSPETVLVDTKYYAEITTSTGTLANFRVYAVKVNYDHP
jgi:hypothetical protein